MACTPGASAAAPWHGRHTLRQTEAVAHHSDAFKSVRLQGRVNAPQVSQPACSAQLEFSAVESALPSHNHDASHHASSRGWTLRQRGVEPRQQFREQCRERDEGKPLAASAGS